METSVAQPPREIGLRGVVLECRRLPVRLLLLLVVLFAGVAVGQAAVEQSWASRAGSTNTGTPIMQEVVCPANAPDTGYPCSSTGRPDGQVSQNAAGRRTHSADRDAAAVVAAQRSLLGAVAFTAGLGMTTPGLVLVVFLATTLTAAGGPGSVPARVTAVTAAVTGGVLGSAVLVFASGSTVGRWLWPITESADVAATGPTRAVARLGLLVLVVGVFAALVTLTGAIVRQRVGTVLAGLLVVVLLNIGSALSTIQSLTPFGVLADVAEFTTHPIGWDCLMALPGGGQSVATPLPGMVRLGGCVMVTVAVLAWLATSARSRTNHGPDSPGSR